ncbi:hypothetical protein [Pseudomonas sp. F(2018)]|uniref:hypothetical protein n=1 Tax=Pseudomonas sp. F(2018) TaxID=2502240 RepID=UPI0010F9EBB7|nr:hypothetical protein [Pseudomonas sp. F(2018)]
MAGEFKTSIVMQLVDRLTAPLRRVTQSLAGISRRAGFDQVTASARRVREALGGAVNQALNLGKRLAWVGGAAAAATFGIGKLVGGVAELGNEIKISSERLGVGARWLQEWMYVAGRFGVNNDALVDGLKELGLRADEFVVTGSGGAAESFERLGITVKDLRATAGETDKLLDLVLSRMGKIQNDAARQRIFDELFGGTGGEQFVAMLTQSREELAKLRQAAHDNGAILSDEDIEQSRAYTRNMADLGAMLTSIRTTVASALLPTINEWLGSLRDMSKANRQAISQEILTRLRQLWAGMRAFGNAVAWAADFVGGFGRLAAIVAGLLAGKFLLSLFLSAVAFSKFAWSVGLLASKAVPVAITAIRALSLALVTTPIGWIILGITALAGAVYLIYRNWDSIAEWFGNLWAKVKAFFSRGIGEIAKDLLSFTPAALLMKAVDAVFELFGARPLSEIGKEWVSGLWDGVSQRFEQFTSWVKQKVGALTEWMPDWMTGGNGLSQRFAAPAAGAPAAASLGAPALAGRPSPLAMPGRADVGGELRIKIDSEGRPRVASMKANGGLDYSVETGLLGMVP